MAVVAPRHLEVNSRLVQLINFRYHLVSLLAVFLSLTLGIALGSTVVKTGVLDGLNRRINQVSNEKSLTDVENAKLRTAAQRLNAYVAGSGQNVVKNTLTGADVVVVALRGVDSATVESETTLLQTAGAQVPAIIWLEPKWLLTTEQSRADLRAALSDATESPGLAEAGLKALADRIAGAMSGPSIPTTRTTSAVADADPIAKLSTAGFVSVQAAPKNGRTDLAGFPSSAQRAVILVSGFGIGFGPVTPQADTAIAAFTALAAKTFGRGPRPVVVAERDKNIVLYPDRGMAMAALRSNSALSTVDSLDTLEGVVVAVLAAAAALRGGFGHFGYGPGSSSALPIL